MPPVTTATSPIVPVRQDLVGNGTIRYHAMDSLRAAMMLLGIVLHAGLSYTHMPRSPIWPFRDARSSVVCDAVMMASGLFACLYSSWLPASSQRSSISGAAAGGCWPTAPGGFSFPFPLMIWTPILLAPLQAPALVKLSRPGDHDGRDAGRV
jgi:hypothetical protein